MRSRRTRQWGLVAGCAVAAAILLAASVAAVWADRVLLDEDRFSSRVVSTMEDDLVSNYLATQLTDQLIARAPDLITVRPALEIVLEEAVRSRTARAGARNAVREAHRGLRAGVPTESLVLDLRAARSLADLFLLQSAPAIAEQLPRDIDSARIDGALVGLRTDVFSRAEDLARVMPLLLVLSGVMVGATVLAAPTRRGGVLLAGAAIVAGGALGLGAQRIIDELLASLLPGPVESRDAVTVLWRSVMQDYSAWNTALVAVGVVTGSAALAVTRVPDRAELRGYLQRSAWARAGGGALLAFLGIALVRWPQDTLYVLVLVLGALLATAGMTLLLRSIYQGLQQLRTSTPRPSYRAPRMRPPIFAGVATAAVLVLLGVWFWEALREQADIAPHLPITTCNGHEDLCDVPLNEVVFAGTHNSMAAASERGWFFPQQRGGIAEQLRNGIRAFLIDTYYGEQTANGVRTIYPDGVHRDELIARHGEETVLAMERVAARLLPGGEPGIFLCHSFCELGATPMRSALASMRDYLDAQPGTFLVLFIQDQTLPQDTIAEFQRLGLGERAYAHTPGDPWPTLGSLLERGKQLLVLVETDAAGLEDWYQPAWEFVQDTPYDVEMIEDFDCSLNRGPEDADFLLLNHWLAVRPATPALALEVNQYEFLMPRVEACAVERGRLPTVIAVDFYDAGDLFDVVADLNGISQ